MNNLENILLVEQTPEAMEAVKSGNAIVSAGGIRRKGDTGRGFLELSKPASMSVADFQSLFEGKEHALETDEYLRNLDARLNLSTKGLQEIEDIGWLNNSLLQSTYTLTYDGFQKMLAKVEEVISQVSELERYMRSCNAKELYEKTQTYINFMHTDAGHMCSEKYSVTNGNIAEHLDLISALLKRLLNEVETENTDVFLNIQILINLIQPFAYVVRRYTALYFYENDRNLMPGNYKEWMNVLSSARESIELRHKIEYYIRLYSRVSFREKVLLSREVNKRIKATVSNVEFDLQYINAHSKEDYLSLDDQVRKKIVAKEFDIYGENAIIWLG